MSIFVDSCITYVERRLYVLATRHSSTSEHTEQLCDGHGLLLCVRVSLEIEVMQVGDSVVGPVLDKDPAQTCDLLMMLDDDPTSSNDPTRVYLHKLERGDTGIRAL